MELCVCVCVCACVCVCVCVCVPWEDRQGVGALRGGLEPLGHAGAGLPDDPPQPHPGGGHPNGEGPPRRHPQPGLPAATQRPGWHPTGEPQDLAVDPGSPPALHHAGTPPPTVHSEHTQSWKNIYMYRPYIDNLSSFKYGVGKQGQCKFVQEQKLEILLLDSVANHISVPPQAPPLDTPPPEPTSQSHLRLALPLFPSDANCEFAVVAQKNPKRNHDSREQVLLKCSRVELMTRTSLYLAETMTP